MKKTLFIIVLIVCSLLAKAQTSPFPTTDSLKRFINRGIGNSAAEAFQNLRLNTSMIGKLRFIQNSDIDDGIDTVYLAGRTLTLTTSGGDTMDVDLCDKLDSLHIYTATNPDPDTLYQYKAGDSSLVGLIPKGTAVINLDTTRTDTTIIVINSIGSDATLPPADTLHAGVMRATDKKKLNRLEPFNGYPDLRTKTNLDTSVIYTDSKRNWFKYDQDDASSSDDTATVIVTSGGARLKRVFNSIYRPEDFGAKGDGTTDDWWPWQKMMNYIGTTGSGGMIFCDARANYRVNDVIILPVLANTRILSIQGNGAKMTGNSIFRRRPSNQSNALNVYQGVKVVIDKLLLTMSGTRAGSIAVELGATYGAEVSNCQFVGYDSALVFRFGLNSVSRNSIFTNVNNGPVFTTGQIWGGSTSNSQSNGSVSINDRVVGLGGGGAAFTYISSSDCKLVNFISEGGSMDYAVRFDDQGTTVVKGFIIDGGHVEMSGGPARAAFYISQNGGVVEIKNIYMQVCDTAVITDNSAITKMKLSNWGWWPAGCKILNLGTASAPQWEFNMMPFSWDWTDYMLMEANTGGYANDPRDITNYSTEGISTMGPFDIRDSTGNRGFSMPQNGAGAIRIYGGPILFHQSDSYNIGNSATSGQPNTVFVGNAVVIDTVSSRGVRWATATGVGLAHLPNDNQSLVTVRGSGIATVPTGSFGMPFGTTAQRSTTNRNGLTRLNTDSTSLEFKQSNAWSVLATRNWTRSNFTTQSALNDTAAAIRSAIGAEGSISGSGTSGHVTFWNGGSSITSDANLLYSANNTGMLSLGTSSTVGHLNIGGNRNFDGTSTSTAWGVGAKFESATFTDNVTSASGTTNFIHTNMEGPIIAASNSGVTAADPTTLRVAAPTAGINVSITGIPYAISTFGGAAWFNGAVKTAIDAAVDNSTVSYRDNVLTCDATSANFNVNLPSASTYSGISFTFKRIDNSVNTCTVSRSGSDTIDGNTSYSLTAQYKYVKVVSDGTNWLIIANN